MAAAPAPASGLLARALNPVAAASASVAAAASGASASASTELLASGLATSSRAIVSTTSASTVHVAASRSSAAAIRSSTTASLLAAGGGSGSFGASTSARTFMTTASALVKDAPATAKPTAPATSVLREATRNPEANSRMRVTDGPPPDLSYVAEGTPVTSEDPKKMPAASAGSVPLSQTQHASASAGARHPGAAEMARGATLPGAGEDAITPEERNVKNWGPNQRDPTYNPEEGRRNPVLHGGSNEGGFDADGKSRT